MSTPNNMPVPTEAEIRSSISWFRQTFPEDEQLKEVSDDELMAKVSDYVNSGKYRNRLPDYTLPPSIDISMPGISDCAIKIGIVVFDCVTLAISFAGLYVKMTTSEEEAIVKGIAQTVNASLPMWKQLIQAVKDAKTVTEQAKAIFAIVKAAYKAGMFGAIWSEIKKNMSWWDWIISGVAAVAQIAALVLTDGAAFIAELVLHATSVAQTVSDAVKAYQACN